MAGNVSNISGFMVNKINGVNPVKETQQEMEEAIASFQSLLMQQPNAKNANVSQDANETIQPVQQTEKKQKELETAFEKAGMKKESARVETPKEAEAKDPEQLKEVKDAIEEGIEKILTEETELTEEEVEEALETLNLQLIDLTIPENLVAVIEEAAGIEEDTELLLKFDLNEIRTQINELVDNLTEENGISLEDLKALGMTERMEPLTDEILPQADFVVPEENASKENAPVQILPEDMEQTKILSEQTKTDEIPEDAKKEVPVGKLFEESTPKAEEFRTMTPEEPAEEPKAMVQEVSEEKPKQNTAGNQDQNPEEFRQTAGQKNETEDITKTLTHHENANAAAEPVQQQPQQTVTFEQPVEAPRPQINPQEIISQFAEFARTSITADSSSFEMQLNPATLGRILINVTEQQGNVTARLETQNLEVKEILEAQIAQLRTTLENAGIKVTQVEVTVASHEFERNLEEGNAPQAGAEEQGEKPREGQDGSGRRTLRSDDLDGLSGLMSEEERLAAQIMIDNGNTMDAKA